MPARGKPKNWPNLALSGIPEGQRAYQTLGDMYLYFNEDRAGFENYRRELDLNEAIVRVYYSSNGVNYEREIFATAVDGIIVMRIKADREGAISFRLNLNRGKRMGSDYTTGFLWPLDDLAIVEGKVV